MKTLCWTLFIWIGVGIAVGQQKRPDTIVAIVNDEIVTYGEVYNQIKEGLIRVDHSTVFSTREKEMKKQEIFRLGLQRLVDQKLTMQEARRYNIAVPEETVQEQLAKDLAEYEGRPTGIDEVDLTDMVRHRLTLRELFEKKTGYSKEEKRRAAIDPYVSPSEIREYYQRHIEQFTEKKQIKVRLITLFYNKNGGREETMAIARELVRELREGADFAEMARNYSQDDPATVEAGGASPLMREYLFSLDIGYLQGIKKDFVPEDLREQFKENECELPEGLKVKRRAENWILSDRDAQKKYYLEKSEKELKVYEEDRWIFIAKGEALYRAVEDIAFTMGKGEISDPIAVNKAGFCRIIKVEDIKPGGVQEFVEVQDDIRQMLRYRKIVAAYERMTMRLRQEAFIWPPNLFDESTTRH